MWLKSSTCVFSTALVCIMLSYLKDKLHNIQVRGRQMKTWATNQSISDVFCDPVGSCFAWTVCIWQHIHHSWMSLSSSSRCPRAICCPQVQVIKHRPRRIQKAYPGLLEPGSSDRSAASPSEGASSYLYSFFLSLLLLLSNTHISHRRSVCLPGDAVGVTTHLSLQRTKQKSPAQRASVCVLLSHFDTDVRS